MRAGALQAVVVAALVVTAGSAGRLGTGGDAGDGPRSPEAFEQDVVDGTTMCQHSAGEWQTQARSRSDHWGDSESLTRQRQILDSGNVTIVGSGTVDGLPRRFQTTACDPLTGPLSRFEERKSVSPRHRMARV